MKGNVMEKTMFAGLANQSLGQRRLTAGAVAFIVVAGVLHLWLAPQHLEHVGHALFLALAGIVEIVWAIAFWRKPSAALYSLGVVLAGAFIVLWAITRITPAPFGHGPGDVELVGVMSKVAEGAGLAGLVAIALLGFQSGQIQWSIWRMILAPLTLAVVGALVLYGVGVAAEGIFPWLGDQDHTVVAAQRGDLAPSINHAEHGAASSAQPEANLTINVELTDDGFQPSSVFIPMGRRVLLVVRNRGLTEHHYRVLGLVPKDLLWLAQDIVPADASGIDPDDHSAHHEEVSFVPLRFASESGIRPTGTEVHAYAQAGELDAVMFTATKTGTFTVRCPLHPEMVGKLIVFSGP